MHEPDERQTPEVVTEPRAIERAPIAERALDRLVESIAEASPVSSQTLPSGRVLEVTAAGAVDVVTIKSPSGQVELAVTLTADGPRLRFESAELELAATREVRVDCDRFTVRAKRDITHHAGGDFVQHIGGESRSEVRGKLTTRSLEACIEATRGNVNLEANDDVRLLGERIKLNC